MVSVLWIQTKTKSTIIQVQKEKTPCGNKTIMPKVKDIITTQFFKIFTLLKERGEMTGDEISALTGYPVSLIRRICSELYEAGRLEKKFIYRIKDQPIPSQ